MVVITVASEHVDELRAGALGLYAVKAEAVHRATNEYLMDRESVCPVVQHRTEARAVELLIDQLGWPFTRDPRPVDVRGPAWLLTELLTSVLIGRLESLVDLLTPAGSGVSLDLGSLGRKLDGARALVALLGDVSAQGQGRDAAGRAATAISC